MSFSFENNCCVKKKKHGDMGEQNRRGYYNKMQKIVSYSYKSRPSHHMKAFSFE
jgi:hypothetical protein